MKGILLVATGGAIGSVGRHLLSGWALHHAVESRFPLGTFLVNVLGCLCVGILVGLVVKHECFSTETRVFLLTGVAGGFTTFSAFGLETFYLFRRGDVLLAAGYVAASVVVGLLAVWGGFQLVSSRG